MSIVTTSYRENNQNNLTCFLIPSLDSDKWEQSNWQREIDIPRHWSFSNLCDKLKRNWNISDGHFQLILFNENQIRNLSFDQIPENFLHDFNSSIIYFYFDWNSKSALTSFPLSNEFSGKYSDGIHIGLFIHIFIEIEQNKQISEIKYISSKDLHLRTFYIEKLFNECKIKSTIDDLVLITDKYEVFNETSIHEIGNCSIVTITKCPPSFFLSNDNSYFKSTEAFLRCYIYSVILNKSFYSKLNYFLNSFDTKKQLKLEREQLELSLLTLIELFKERFNKTYTFPNGQNFNLNYFDLLIPDSNSLTWTYNDSILIFADTIVQYLRTRYIISIEHNFIDSTMKTISMNFVRDFLSCLKDTLNMSLAIDADIHRNATILLVTKRTVIYIFYYLFAPIICISKIASTFIKRFSRKYTNRKCIHIIGLESLKLLLWMCFIVSVFNIIQYYWFSVKSYQANEIEIYWPLALIISSTTIVHVYQGSKDYRELSQENQSVKKAYSKAYFQHLQAKSKPDIIKSVDNNRIVMPIIDENDFHPNLFQQSVLSNQKKSTWEYSFSHFIFLLFLFLTVIGFTLIHTFIPMIYRWKVDNQISNVTHWQVESIRYSYIIFSLMFYCLLIILMMVSIEKYSSILHIWTKLLNSTNLMTNIDAETRLFLNLYQTNNLEYFLLMIRSVKRDIDSYHLYLSTMACALIMDIILILTAIIHVIIYGHSTDLLTILCSVDITILSIFIMIFIVVVVRINKLIIYDFIRYLKKLKKNMITSNVKNENIAYYDSVIDDVQNSTDEYAVKLFGFIVDQKLAAKVLVSICTGIGSTIISFIKNG